MLRTRGGARHAGTLLTAGAAALGTVLAPSVAAVAAGAAPAFPRSLVAWGDDTHGQLGDGKTKTAADAPVRVKLPAGTKVSSFRAGCESSVVLTAAGRVLDFGSNAFGQLGNGKKAGSAVPVQASFPAGTKVTAVRAGCDFNLALTAGGRVFAWGENPADAQPEVAAAASALPARVRFPVGTTIKAISAGGDLSLALTTGGQVYAWGANDAGQLGNGTRRDSRVPVRVSLPKGVKATAIAAGGTFAMALTSSGQVLAWGANVSGELGIGTAGSQGRAIPVRVRLPGGTKVRSLFAGSDHALVLTASGRVLAWGDNFLGELGDGTTTDRKLPVPARIAAGTTIRAITAAGFQSVALASDGSVLTWGKGPLGDGKGESSSPLPVTVALGAGMRAISVGAGPASFSGLALVEQFN